MPCTAACELYDVCNYDYGHLPPCASGNKESPTTNTQQLKRVIDRVRLLCVVAIDENKNIVPSKLLEMVNDTH